MPAHTSLPSDPRWSYDDPSGVPDEVAITFHMPERLLPPVQEAAARDGLTPSAWLLELVTQSVRP
jgi:hypothetical protein